jgi:hypothetical protein
MGRAGRRSSRHNLPIRVWRHVIPIGTCHSPQSYRVGQLVVEYATVCFRSQEDFGPKGKRTYRLRTPLLAMLEQPIKSFLSYSSKDKLFADQPYVRMSPSGLTGSTFQSEERDQLLIHDLPVMIGALRTNFIPLDLNEARSRKRDPATGSRSTAS